MSKTTNRIITALFSVFIGGFFLLNLLLPDKDFSEKENRQLQTLPKFSFSSLFSGSFATRFESYCSDQFAGRDTWIETKAGAELAQGKQQNNGVFLCDGGRLIEPFEAPEEDVLARAVQAADLLTDTGVPVSLALIPTTAQLYADILPDGAPNDEQQAVINSADAQTALGHDRSFLHPHGTQQRIHFLSHRPPLDVPRRLLCRQCPAFLLGVAGDR